MSMIRARFFLLSASILWASAFVGIRAGLQSYSPGPLALLRFMVASFIMLLIYPVLPLRRKRICFVDRLSLLMIGVIGLGCYNIMLNYGETIIASGVASFIISLSPVVTVIFASLFLGEKFNIGATIGMLISIAGVGLIAFSEFHDVHLNAGMTFMIIATVICGLYSVVQKPFLDRYHAIDVTAWILWGCTLFLLFYFPRLWVEYKQASVAATFSVIYLGVFPAALGYIAWSYGSELLSASKAAGYLYFMPIFASIFGWLILNEIPSMLSIIGGFIILAGVWVVSHQQRKLIQEISTVNPT